jgi:hypothetical protein
VPTIFALISRASRRKPTELLRTTCIALSITLLPVIASAQAVTAGGSLNDIVATTAAASTNGAGPAGIVPYTKGFNLSLGTTSQHDSSNGWSSLLSPGVAYRFNRRFSLDASIPIYDYINIDQTKGTKAKPVFVQSVHHFVVGDTAITAQLDTHRFLDYTASVTLGLPSGNTTYGLGAGQSTYDINNHFEHYLFDFFTPDIELGIGDSSALVDSRIRKSYTSVGTIAHFQAGASFDLPFNMNFEADAYEILPLDASTIYSTTGKGKRKVTVATGTTVAEDNGFITSLDIPLNPHVILSGFYNRSLRAHDDVAGFSFTFLLKAPPRIPEIR